MEPRIQYAKTKDGLSIAYASRGQGPVLVLLPAIWEQFALNWQAPQVRDFLGQLGQGRRLVHYDRRGFGLSQREVTEFSLESEVADLDAVISALKLRSVALFASTTAGPGAIAYAARHPRIVRNLILYGTFSRAVEVMPPEQLEALINLSRTDWNRAAQFFADSSTRELHPEEALQIAERFRQSANGENAAKLLASGFDVDDLLPQVRSRALVIHRRGDALIPFSLGQNMAAKLPNAQLVPLEGSVHPYFLGDTSALIDVIDNFLGEAEPKPEEPSLPHGMTAILFLDIADSTALTTKLGDAAYREKERALDTSLRAAITDAGGTPVEGKVLGDGVMAVFTSARQAIDAAQRCRDLGNEAGLPLHLGIHAGDVVREGNNVHGGAVQVAARVQSVAAPGEILVSATVRDLARTSAGVAFEDRGEHELKGIDEPQRLFAVKG